MNKIAIRDIERGITIDEKGNEIPSNELINYELLTIWPLNDQIDNYINSRIKK
jgi:hypothetical protein